MRWGLRLSDFDFEIRHRKGTENANADALSRLPLTNFENTDDEDQRRALQNGVATAYEDIPGLGMTFMQLNVGSHNVAPFRTEWIAAQDSCPELGLIKKHLSGTIDPPNSSDPSYVKQKYSQLAKWSKQFELQADGLLINRCKLASGVRGLQMYETVAVPISKREAILTSFHGTTHLGINKTYRKMRERFYWPHIQRDVKRFIVGCHLCRSRKDSQPSLAGKLQPFLHQNTKMTMLVLRLSKF